MQNQATWLKKLLPRSDFPNQTRGSSFTMRVYLFTPISFSVSFPRAVKRGVFMAATFLALSESHDPAVAGAATAAPGMAALRAEAESKGYIFETSHDEIVAKAKREQGAMQAHLSQGPE